MNIIYILNKNKTHEIGIPICVGCYKRPAWTMVDVLIVISFGKTYLTSSAELKWK